MNRICEICKITIPIEHGLWCLDCRVEGYIRAHQAHILFLNEFISGKHWPPIDQDEFEMAKAEMIIKRQQIDQLKNLPSNKSIIPEIPKTVQLPKDPIYSKAEKDRLALYRKVIANGNQQTKNESRDNGGNPNGA